ncbi:MAG: glycosyltransferase [Acidimicrobiia bacterium]
MTATPSPEVVVHVASLNTAAATELCVRSMRHYAGHEFDLVVGDGGSTDGSLETLRDFEQRGWLTLEVAPGGRKHFEWLDQWVAECPARYAVFVDSDVEFLGPNWLQEMLDTARDRDAALVCAQMLSTAPHFRHPVTGAVRTVMGRPAPWLLMLDLAALRGRVDVSFRYVEVEDEEGAGGKIAHDVGGAYFVALKDAGLDWVQLPDAYRKKFRHFGGLSWRSARDSQVSPRARARQIAMILLVHTHLWKARLLRWGERVPG